MNSNDVFKQLAINSLLNSSDLQEQIKKFVFYDKVEAETRRNKRGLNNQLKLGLTYVLDDDDLHHQIWEISYRYERRMQADNCPCCGNFHFANEQDYTMMNPTIACHCNFDYVNEIMSYTQPRTQIIEPDWDYELNMYRE